MGNPRKTSLTGIINRLLHTAQDEDGTPGNRIGVLSEAVDADAYVTLLIHMDKGTASILGGAGLHTPSEKWHTHVQIPGLVQTIADSPGVLVLKLKDPFEKDPFLTQEGAVTLLVAPGTAGERCIATVALGRSPKTFRPAEVDRFAAIAGVINVAEHLNLVLEEPNRLKGTDLLTGLGLFSDFHDSLVQELSRARRNAGSVTMGIMTVVAHKPDPGEGTLLDVARIFKERLRNFDTLDRYGVSELAFILPDLVSSEGVRVVDRIVGEIISSLDGPGSGQDIYVGLSCYPEDGATVERLIEMAEAAMSQAVEEERPGVYRWKE